MESEEMLKSVCCQGSLHDVSPHFLQQTLDKKLMSNMRVSLAVSPASAVQLPQSSYPCWLQLCLQLPQSSFRSPAILVGSSCVSSFRSPAILVGSIALCHIVLVSWCYSTKNIPKHLWVNLRRNFMIVPCYKSFSFWRSSALFIFLSRISTLMHNIDIAILSVHLSVTFQYCIVWNGLIDCHIFFTANIFTKFRPGH